LGLSRRIIKRGNKELESKKHIAELRKNIPIGVITAQKLLKHTEFDVRKAELMWKMDQSKILAENISIKLHEAQDLLEAVKYDFAKALILHQEENTTVMEKIFQSSKEVESVLSNFWVYVTERFKEITQQGGWIGNEGFKELPKPIRNVLIVWQWYAYYDWEGISVEQTTTDQVIDIIAFELEMREFSNELRVLQKMVNNFNERNPFDSANPSQSFELRNKLFGTKKYNDLDSTINKNEILIKRKLYEILHKNMNLIDNFFLT
jgi:hypothetical protein